MIGPTTIIRPLGNRVLVRPIPPSKLSSGGLHLPDVPPDLQREFIILAVGPGEKCAELKEGQRVLCNTYAGAEVDCNWTDADSFVQFGKGRIVDAGSIIAIMGN